MADTPVNSLIQDVTNFQYNPVAIQRAVLQKLADATNGTLEIVDPTNPFVFCLEAASVLTAAFMAKNEASTRKQYPYSAQNSEDLYPHMSDRDFVDRFAIPSTTMFSLLIPMDELLNKMVTDPLTGIRKLVIPRNTYFTVADTNFSIQYPIEIRQLAHGGLQVVYDVTVVSPLQTLTTNVLHHEIRRNADGEWLFIEFDVQQFSIISQTSTLNAATDFKLVIALDDQYYYARVYVEDQNGNWLEITTTHTDQIYDVNNPTAVLQVIDQQLTVTIPQIYTSTFMLNRGIRIDAYQTKGPLNLILWEYPFTAFTATWLALDSADNTVYTAPLKTFRTLIPYSDKVVSGGKNALSFDELRLRVIKNAIGAPSLPITNVQIETALNNQGYDVVKNVDNITNRVFQATKPMPTPIDPKLITAAAASIETLTISLKDAVLVSSIIDNGANVTITPNTVYRNVNGVTSIVPVAELDALAQLSVDRFALAVTQGNYLYTPFHYVLDTHNNGFDSRAYYLDSPEAVTKLFVAENDTTLIQVGTGSYAISRSATGYQIQLVTQSGDEYKALNDTDVQVQLAFVPAGEKDRAYLMGTYFGRSADNERIYTFDLSTNFDVDVNNNLQLEKFFLYTTENRLTGAPLVTEFDILYSTSVTLGAQWQPDQVDQALGRFLLPTRVAGIAHETLRIRFGYALDTLWSRARSVISSVPYKTWDADVPRVYETDQYVRDANGSSISFDTNGNPVSVLLHSAGDPVLDSDFLPTYLHRKGDVMLDTAGNPITTDSRGMLRQIDLMLIEGAYHFATDISATNYKTALTETVVGWLTNDLANLESQLLEQTKIYFYPKTTLGAINVLVADGLVKSIAAGQAFLVTMYVSANVYINTALRERLSKTTVTVISDQLKGTVISIDSIATALRNQYGDDVISVQVSGLGGDLNLPALTIIDPADRCSIRKRLVALADNSLIVEEDITIDFVRHEIRP